jgi:hypothetical protein
MKHSLFTPALLGACALGLSAVTAAAQPNNVDLRDGAAAFVLVRGGGGGGGGGHGGGFGGGGGHGGSFGGGVGGHIGGFASGGHAFSGGHGQGFGRSHGIRGRHFRGFTTFGDPFYDDSCWWSARYHRRVCS